MSDLLVFTHIPKTAGTSFLQTAVFPNVPRERRFACGGLRTFVTRKRGHHVFSTGHVPYGVHVLTMRKTAYITFLRDPVDRAISYYYFIKGFDPQICNHPDFPLVSSRSIEAFYRDRRHQNIQSRMIAGYAYYRLYPYLELKSFETKLLKQAKRNLLNQYKCFGLQEYFAESVQLFKRELHWPFEESVHFQKKSRGRPRPHELSPDTLVSLQEANSLDVELYQFAADLFRDRFVKSLATPLQRPG